MKDGFVTKPVLFATDAHVSVGTASEISAASARQS